MKRMSFIFPDEFYYLLCDLKRVSDMDMTYIIMDAVTDWVIERGLEKELIGGIKSYA